MRTIARETLFKILFSEQFNDGADEKFRNALYEAEKLEEDDKSYCERVLSAVKSHEGEILKLLDEHSVSFPEKRIYPADRSILLIAIAEILYFDDIPDKVSMSEAGNIASKYSSEKSASFITGILSAISGGKKNV